MRRTGHTLVEVITVALIVGILACVAVPRLNFGAVLGAKADAVVRQIATDLRRARSQAITHAAHNPKGFALVMTGDAPYLGYQIVDLHDASVVANCTFPAGIRCSGGRRFEFSTLGNLQAGGDTQLHVFTGGKSYSVEVVPTTGAVIWLRRNE